jgi:hypothetical protein
LNFSIFHADNAPAPEPAPALAPEPAAAAKPTSPVESIANSTALETVVKQAPKVGLLHCISFSLPDTNNRFSGLHQPPIVDTLAPLKDEPVVLQLSPSTHKASETVPEANGVNISNAPEPYKETNGTLPAETAPSTAAAAKPAEVKPAEGKKVTPPTTPPRNSKIHGRRSINSDDSPSVTTSSIRKKRHSFFGKIKEVFAHEKKEKKENKDKV